MIGAGEPSRILVDCLALRSLILSNFGRLPEAAECGRRALAAARALDYPFGQVAAMGGLIITARFAGDLDGALQLATQAIQIPDMPGRAARACGRLLAGVLADAGDPAAAGRAGAVTLAQVREAAQIALQTGSWFTMINVLDGCVHLCAATGRPADAVTAWTAQETSSSMAVSAGNQTRTRAAARTPCVTRGASSARPGLARPRSAEGR